MLKYYRKKRICSVLFIYVPTHCVDTFKKLDNNKLFQLNQWLCIQQGCERSQVRFLALERIFMFDIVFCCCCFTFLSKTHYLSQFFKIGISTTFIKKVCIFYLESLFVDWSSFISRLSALSKHHIRGNITHTV